MSPRPGFELSKQATRKDILKAALPINGEKRNSVGSESLSATSFGPYAIGKCARAAGG